MGNLNPYFAMLLNLGLPAQGAPPGLARILHDGNRHAISPEEEVAAPNPNEPNLIRRIEVSGVTRLSQKQVRGIVQPYENKPLGLSDINVLLESLTRAYVKQGYATTRVYLPRQNIGKGVLRLQAVEAHWSRFLRPR
jgi:hemolysin activation/secretion protein